MIWILLIFILILQIWSIGLYYKWESYNKKKGENLAMKEDSRDINYEGEKGKNLATKEDIAQITQQIESIKDSYNKSLESHKIDLQKEFESHKYIMGLCQSLDRMLLHNIALCLNAGVEEHIGYPESDEPLLVANSKLSKFLSTYHSRYDNIIVLNRLKQISREIDDKYEYLSFKYHELGEDCQVNVLLNDKKKQLIEALNAALMYFIPKLVPQE